MRVWKVEQRYFDNGSINVSVLEIDVENMPESGFEKFPSCDYYCDYFSNKNLADIFARDCKVA